MMSRDEAGSVAVSSAPWPPLPLDAWADTCTTLHLRTQIVGKVRLSQAPPVNHSWHVVLYVTSRGLTTSPVPYGSRSFQIDVDFIDHRLTVECSDGAMGGFALRPQSVANFHARLMELLRGMGLHVRMGMRPNEVAHAVPFDHNEEHHAYDPEYANWFRRVLVGAERVLQRFRYSPELREFILPYETVRLSASPDATLLDFLQTTYEAAAALGGWDRGALERSAAPYPVV